MYHMYNDSLFDVLSGGFLSFALPLFLIFAIWSIVWKGWALWLAARRGETPWFIALLIINTAGILEIFYIFVIAKQSDKKEEVTRVVPDKEEKV